MEFLQGKKTYICAALIYVATAAYLLGYIDEQQYKAVLTLLGGGAIAALRSAIGKIENSTPKVMPCSRR